MSCQHIINKGKNTERNCKNKGVKGGEFCNKHKKREDVDLNKDAIFGDKKQKVIKIAAAKTKFSVFKYTLNSNKDFSNMTTEQKINFKQFVEFAFDKANITKILQDKTNPADAAKNIEKIESEFYFEIGEKYGRLHTHGIIKIEHVGHYSIMSSAFQKIAELALGYKVHFSISASGDPNAAWKAYITKKAGSNVIEL